MRVVRSDGLLELIITDAPTNILDFIVKNDYIGVELLTTENLSPDLINVNGFILLKSKFPTVKGNINYLPSACIEGAELYRSTDNIIDKHPYYIKGIFGYSTSGFLIDKYVNTSFTTNLSNKYLFRQDTDLVKLLLIESKQRVPLKDTYNDVTILGSAINGKGISVGLQLSPTSTGLLNTPRR